MVSPARAVIVQFYDQIILLAKPVGLNAVIVYGGAPNDAQQGALRRAHIEVALPG
jgi:superfamily II DNA/RNA helicase